MEKNRTNIFISAKVAFTAIFILFVCSLRAQKMQTFKGHCGSFYSSMAHLYKIKQPDLDFYEFKAGQTIASIGAQCCHWEAAYAATTDSITFYVEDIDTSKFKKEHADYAWIIIANLEADQ